MSLNKLPLKSKKFIALFFIVIVLAGLLAFTLCTQIIGWPLAAFACLIVVTIGILGVGYILGQAALDKYITITMATINNTLEIGNDDDEKN